MHRIVASTLLIAYLATGTPVIPAAVALLAALDGSHSVTLTDSGCGAQLVLGHRHGNYTPELRDHASPIAKVLVAFCRPDANCDHQFAAAWISGNATPVRSDTKCDLESASCADQPVPDILTTEHWRSRGMDRAPTPTASSRDVEQLQHCRELATVHLVI